jgi:hypothetical protein
MKRTRNKPSTLSPHFNLVALLVYQNAKLKIANEKRRTLSEMANLISVKTGMAIDPSMLQRFIMKHPILSIL